MKGTQGNPVLIQGGMGVAVSSWPLARAVSNLGHLGTVSGTGLDTVFTRRLQTGDPGGHMRRALDHFPVPEMADRIWRRYYLAAGKSPARAFKSKPIPSLPMPKALTELIVAANFCEVFLAKEGHGGIVALNLLEKIQLPTLASLYGAMLAGVDFVAMGAGIPLAIPGALDSLARLEPTDLRLNVIGAGPDDRYAVRFDPAEFGPVEVRRPRFLAVVGSATLATTLVRRAGGVVDGCVVEMPTAGGHNAPPRGPLTLDDHGEPVYGPRDEVDFDQLRSLGIPFWLAGSYATPDKLREALALGANGVQIGTAFAFCEESGIDSQIRAAVIERIRTGSLRVRTDPVASPTGFPFKVAELEGTISETEVRDRRTRICDLGYLRTLYRTESGKVGYRCAGEPVADYVSKGGTVQDTVGRTCLCNGLTGTVGLGQVRATGPEPAIVTAGNDVVDLGRLLTADRSGYSAADVVAYVTGA